MKYQPSDIERKILVVLQEGFPRIENPYKDIAEKAGIETKQLPAVLENRKREEKLRRTGTISDHFKAVLSVRSDGFAASRCRSRRAVGGEISRF